MSTISLGSTSLNPDLLWIDRDSWQPVIQNAQRTLGGKLIVKNYPLFSGRPITLEAVENKGWLSLSEITSIIQMASVPGGVYSLIIGSETFQVVFKHSDPPAVDFQPIISKLVSDSGDYFTGRIKLLTL